MKWSKWEGEICKWINEYICFIPYYILAAIDPTLFDMVENCEDVKEELKEIENQKN